MTVDLSAVEANVARLRATVAPAEVWAVVKADAYGHGAVPVGRAALAAGATKLCVATWEEARSLRDGLPDAAILVMSPLSPGRGRRGRRRRGDAVARATGSPGCAPRPGRRSTCT